MSRLSDGLSQPQEIEQRRYDEDESKRNHHEQCGQRRGCSAICSRAGNSPGGAAAAIAQPEPVIGVNPMVITTCS
ncbi:MAG: hypothetical protein JWR11_5651 [Mycobacterium sp.]|nr:hypothetical protein [Mycobacterium sp.]MDT5070238.1 hypothetical protein [Mycobacterium sp.]